MKHKTLISIASVAALLAVGTSSSTAEEVDGVDIPTGSLTVDKKIVMAKEVVNIGWDVNFPIPLPEIVTPELKIKMKTKVQAFMIGTAVSNHRTKTNTSVNLGSGWLNLYTGYGTGNKWAFLGYNNAGRQMWAEDTLYDPNVPIHERVAPIGTNLNFAAKLADYSNWIYKDDKRVLVMYSGDRPSSKEGWGGDASLEDYIAPYLKDGVLDIGEHDIMLAAELTHSWDNRNSSGYDSNDSIALLRFIPVED